MIVADPDLTWGWFRGTLLSRWLTSEHLSGTSTFLFTDIEGSTRLLHALGRVEFGELMADQQRLLREAFAAYRGQEIDTQGDSFFVAFRSATDAVSAAVAAQRAVAAHSWPGGAEVAVRMGIHSGEATTSGERYLGLSVVRAARIGAAAHGGQVLLSSSTRELVEDDLPEGVRLRDLGLVQLKDLERPERIWQLAAENLPLEFPPLRGAQRIKEAPTLRRRTLLVAMLAGVVAAAVAVPVFALGSGSEHGTALTRLGANAVGAIDPSTGSLVASVPVGESPDHVAYGARPKAIWAANSADNTVSRIDPKTRRIVQTSIPVGNDPSGIAVGGSSVWVANALDGTVSRINTAVNQVVGAPIPVGNGPRGVAYFKRAVWVALYDDREIARIDPSSEKVSRIPLPAAPKGLAVGAGSVWASNPDEATVTQINPAGQVVATIGVGHGPDAIAFGDGAVWVANSLDGTVFRIDPRKTPAQVNDTIQVGHGPSGIAVTPDGVLVANEDSQTISRIDPRNDDKVVTYKIGNRPQGLAMASGLAWVGVDAGAAVHKGGTLTILNAYSEIPFVAFDPTIGFGELTTLMFDGLTVFRRVGGVDGYTLAPDLATTLPTPTDHGKTYTFQLRRRIRYSTGAFVRPEDVRRGIERMFELRELGGAAGYFTGIVGAARCAEHKGHCDLSQGIVTNDDNNTVTFHLVAPDPEFPDKLAVPGAFVVPAGTPAKPITKLPLPATGPYMIHSATNKRIEFVRNPRFRAWSPARPSGYVNRILILNKGTGNDVPVDAVLGAIERKRADYSISLPDGEITPPLRQKLKTLYPELLQSFPVLGFQGLDLNTKVAPFNHQAVRKAISDAIDRRRASSSRYWVHKVVPACQVLPPNFRGYKTYCPYTRNEKPNGPPNLGQAHALVNGSGTRGTPVTITTDTQHKSIAQYLTTVLAKLGYPTRVKVPKVGEPWGNTQAQITFGFQADYPTPADFFLQFTCALTSLATHFCNHKIDRTIARTERLQASQPAQAGHIWTKLDHQITDQAPEVFLNLTLYDFFVSPRVHNFQYHQLYRTLYDQIWVK